ncbi:DUF2567 domain-containing protein [Nocardia camponoti]|uniref:DUF2567 domain-containing protein n=1 Tax=Nocardia camponoti TaxID=1616106 RepID=A0A917VDY2_9NOCA|nr:DUF2567 domain-containing protein [Nocardia camponoti]GGK68450.1 hypothetical protein GCM10011591_45740 [Nocardia camponoti]
MSGVRREVTVIGVVAAAIVGVSALVGVAWGLVAPTERLRVVQPGRAAVLTGESMHLFDGVGMFLCLGAVVGVLSVAAAWRVRSARGPVLGATVLVASGLGAAAMMFVGEGVAGLVHPRPTDPAVGAIIALPAEVGTVMALIVQPFIAALIMVFLAALHPRSDLGSDASGLLGDLIPVERDDDMVRVDTQY